jgi:fucose 4-O-acetylase-like acetyltransferase
LSIFLVILFHVYLVTKDDSGQRIPSVETFNDTFAQFRMPAMLFLSGLFVPRSIGKGSKEYFVGKIRTIAYPYFLWSGIMLVFLALAAQATGRSFEVKLIAEVFFHPIEHLWFLAYLFIYFIMAFALKRLNPLIPAVAFFALSLAPIAGRWLEFWYLACFFMLGVAAVQYSTQWARLTSSLKVAIPLAALPLGVFVLLAQPDAAPRQDPALVLLALSAIAGTSGLMMRFGHHSALRPVRYVGENSIVFYLVHWPIAICMSQMGSIAGLPPLVLFTVSSVATVALSWVVAAGHARSPIVHALFVFPGGTPERVTAP